MSDSNTLPSSENRSLSRLANSDVHEDQPSSSSNDKHPAQQQEQYATHSQATANTVDTNRPLESINSIYNDSNANLLSSASQALETSSLHTNYSSDCVVTYDSDGCWPPSYASSSSKINATQGSATRLNTNHGSGDESNTIRDNMNTFCGDKVDGEQVFVHEHQFTIGPPHDNDENMLYILDEQQQSQFNPLEVGMYDPGNIRRGSQGEDDDGEYDSTYDPCKQVIVGICAMEKKAQSKPMKEILRRLEDYFEYIKTLVFEESVILNKPIEEWPLCDCLISFHSKGFPLSKAIEYARLRRPFLVNDLDIQYDIQDRRKVYKILEEADIELPRYVVLDRDSANPEERELVESDDHIEVSNFIFNKPFVEKPISAEDHNICIYYPAHAGGGSQRLFRKIGCRSSVYSNESHVRKTGSYIYEEFMPTDGTDVKVYTAGPDYAHAEARKSPALDGKVERDMDGKEIRYPVILTNNEKLIARKVCLAFKQTVCGFDLLRANGRSYVCDVNGFSFVKSSMKYYEDCSKILGNMMLRALAPQLHIPWSIPFQLDDPPIVPTTFGRMMELRCVIAVIRHGDRTPKQKMKLEVKHPKFFELYHKYGTTKNGQAKLKKPKQLQEVLDIARYLLGELSDQPLTGEVVEPRVKLRQLKSVLEMYGHFSGINRKVQLKYQPHGRPRRSSSEDEIAREPSLVLILKWGGELTPAGRVQAEDLGRCFRRLYPASGDYSGPQGLGLLRLHSTFRHDLKIYASDEGRVQMTAAAFAKGFLALEGELTPILFQMVKSANTNGLLDNDCESSKCQKIVKERLHNIMQKDLELTKEDMKILNPTDAPSIDKACRFISNPHQACEKVHKLIKELNALIRSKRQDNCYTQEYHLYHGETWDLLQRRWAKLEKDFKFPRTKRFDISKIPDIYDCIKYDLQHNQHTLQFQHAHELHTYAKALADIVIPQEYGMTSQEKLTIGLGTCSPLLRKIQADLLRNADSTNEDETESVNRLDPKYSYGVSSPDRHVRTRLYFTSESHIHSLVTALQFGGLLDVKNDEQWKRSMEFLSAISELNYLSQIVIMLYEDPTKEPSSDDRFHVEIHFSSGVINRITQQNMPTEPQGPGFRPHLHNKSYSNASSTGSGNKDIGEQSAGNKQQRQDAMIKEEMTDDERSTDGESRGHSKSSSVCMTPKKVIQRQSESRKASTDKLNKESVNVCELADGEDITSAEDLEHENSKTLTQTTARELSSKAQSRCLARSYSAITPISLQDLFNRGDSEDAGAIVEPREEVIPECGLLPVADPGSAGRTVTCTDKAVYVPTDTKLAALSAESAVAGVAEAHVVPAADLVAVADVAGSTSEGEKVSQSTSVIRDNQADGPDSQTKRRPGKDPTTRAENDKGPNGDADGAGNRTRTPKQHHELPTTPKISVKNNWKTYEQYLAGELSVTPSHLLHYQRRRRHFNQQQLMNLPPTYHTIHHWNHSPSALNSLAAHQSSASMSTSPQQLAAGLQQCYAALKQQQAGKHHFTLSASMPIQYKSNQNPRACSVADVSQYCGGPSSLISTAVISGSSPELVAVCPYSPNIRPLETLHNELSLKQFIDFVVKLTRNHRPSSNLADLDYHRHQRPSHHHPTDGAEARDLGASTGRLNGGQQHESNRQLSSNQNNLNQTGACMGLSPGNSLSNSLIWSGPPSSFASSPGPASPSAAFELWSKLELEDFAPTTDNCSGNSSSNASCTTNNGPTVGVPGQAPGELGHNISNAQ